MLKTLTLGCYCPGSSMLHRSDPRTKILLTLLLMVTAFSVQSFSALLLLFMAVFGTAGTVGKPFQQSLRGLKPILYLTGVTAVVNIFSIKGAPLVDVPVLQQISREALLVSAKMILRLALLASSVTLLTFTTTPFALANGVENLLQPLGRIGLPTADIAMILLIALRFMPVIVDEAEKLITEQSSRTADFNRGNLLQRIRSYLPLFIPLFAGVARRGDAMATAMEARCYHGSAGRTRMRPLEFSGADLACVALMAVILSLLLGVEYLT